MKTYQNPQPHSVERADKVPSKAKKTNLNKEKIDKKLDKRLQDTFPASDATAKY